MFWLRRDGMGIIPIKAIFSEKNFSRTKASVNHENFVIMRDFIFDISTASAEADK